MKLDIFGHPLRKGDIVVSPSQVDPLACDVSVLLEDPAGTSFRALGFMSYSGNVPHSPGELPAMAIDLPDTLPLTRIPAASYNEDLSWLAAQAPDWAQLIGSKEVPIVEAEVVDTEHAGIFADRKRTS